MSNVGGLDRIVRGVAGVALIIFGILDLSPWRWVWIAGVILVLTAAFRFCPAYWLLRIKTLGSRASTQR